MSSHVSAPVSAPVTAAVRDGLGNQLFIVVSALAHARRQGRPALFRRDAAYGYRGAYWDSLLAAAPSAASGTAECDAIEVGRAGRAHFQEAAHTFAEVPAGADTLLGFFQSVRYFGAEFTAVAADLRLPVREFLRHRKTVLRLWLLINCFIFRAGGAVELPFGPVGRVLMESS